MSELPVDVLSKITSYFLGEPKYLRLKHSNALREIQNEFKITYSKETRRRQELKVYLKYGLYRTGRAFAIESVKHIIKNQKERLLTMMYAEEEGDVFLPFIKITSFIVVKPRLTEESEEDEFVCIEHDTNSISFSENTIDERLETLAGGIIHNLSAMINARINVLGIQGFHFELVCDESMSLKLHNL